MLKMNEKIFYQDTALVKHDLEEVLLSIYQDFSEETIVSFIKVALFLYYHISFFRKLVSIYSILLLFGLLLNLSSVI